MPDYGVGFGPAVHTLHFTECASRLPAVLVFTDYVMPGGCRPGPVNRHSFGMAGRAGSRSAPITLPAPAGWPLSGWRPALRKRKTADDGTRDVPRALEGRAAATPPPAGRVPAGGKGIAGHRGLFPRLHPRPGCAPAPPSAEVFPKLSLHRRPSSRIVLLRTGA